MGLLPVICIFCSSYEHKAHNYGLTGIILQTREAQVPLHSMVSHSSHDCDVLNNKLYLNQQSTSSSINDEIIYPPSPLFAPNFQGLPHFYFNVSSDSLDVQESPGATENFVDTIPTATENLCRYIFNKIKGWFGGLLSYLFMRQS